MTLIPRLDFGMIYVSVSVSQWSFLPSSWEPCDTLPLHHLETLPSAVRLVRNWLLLIQLFSRSSYDCDVLNLTILLSVAILFFFFASPGILWK